MFNGKNIFPRNDNDVDKDMLPLNGSDVFETGA